MKSVVITGSASGMGRATAELLSNSGFKVFGLDIVRTDELKNVEQIVCDVTSIESVENAFKVVSSKVDSIDAIINFAGIIMMNSLVEISEEEFLKIFNINVFGVYRVNKTFLPLLLNNRGKIIITTSEVAENKILPFNGIYGITKKALDAYAEGLTHELGLLGVKVIRIRPGAVKTNILNHSSNSMERMLDNTVLYKDISRKFKKIVDSEQGASIPAEKIAKIVLKILLKKKTKLVYRKNISLKLKLLNMLSTKTQLAVYKKLLK